MNPISKALARRRIRTSGLFDAEYYTTTNPDVANSAHDPLDHFLKYGGREGRSPSSRFDVLHYLQENPAARFEQNPLLDWLNAGKKGKRVPPRPLARQIVAHAAGDTPNAAVGDAPGNIAAVPSQVSAADLELVRKRGVFDAAYYLTSNADVARTGLDPLRHYLETGWRENRNPSAEFDTHFVLATRSDVGPGCPLIDFAAADEDWATRPANSVTFTSEGDTASTSSRIAIQIHLFYSNMIELFWAYLKDMPFGFDFLISVISEADRNFVQNYLAYQGVKANRIKIRILPNRGRDIAPFIVGFADTFPNYDFICHLHSKRSSHAGFGQKWLEWVLRSMFGSIAVPMQAIRHLERSPNCAMVFADNYFEIKRFAGWGGNEARLSALIERWGVRAANLPRYANFAAGSMAWFRADFLATLAQKLDLEDFEEEEGQVEGTLAHIIERAIPLTIELTGRTVTRYYLDRLPTIPPIHAIHGETNPNDPVELRWMRDTPAIARNRPLPLAPLTSFFNPKALHISWIIPDFGLGAGGHMTIFRMVQFLEKFGHHQTLWIQNARNHGTPQNAKNVISRHYREIGDRVHVRYLPDDVRQLSGDVIIATDCWTVFPAATATNFKERFYFIQDYEPYFHAMGENYLIAEATYNMGFAALCAGHWLLKKAEEHGMWAREWQLGVDRLPYFPKIGGQGADMPRRRKKIAFYCRSYTPRRAVALGLAALEELARRRGDFEVILFGEEPIDRRYAFPARQAGILSPAELGNLYRDADAGLSFSTTNYSLVPLEMMACGLPVVEIDSESARTAFPPGAVAFAAVSPHAIADMMERILDDPEYSAQLVQTAGAFAATLDWEDSARAIEAALLERLSARSFRPMPVAAPSIGRLRKASVIIPTYNGGALFEQVLDRVANQDCDFDYDVLVIDSSSTDGTGDFAGRFGGRVRSAVIPQREFQHGRTRNQAIGMTDGEIVAVLTQDAMPQDRHWLGKLMAPFSDAKVGGAIGRHRAYDTHNRFVARDLDTMFDRFRDLGPIFSLDKGLPGFIRPGSADWRLLMHFYSDNNSAMRRSLWSYLPYPEVDWGEDQIWAWEMLRLGHAKAYVDDAVVFHSHDLTRQEQIKVSISEGKMMAHFFGYRLSEAPMDHATYARITSDAILDATRLRIPLREATAYADLCQWSAEGRAIGLARSETANIA